MSEAVHGIVSPTWVGKLLEATYGGSVPSKVDDFVDAEACAPRIEGSKLGVVFDLAGGTPRVRVAHDGESKRLADLAGATFPAAADWIASHAGGDLLYETDGDTLRAYVTGLDGDAVGEIWDDGTVLAIKAHDSLPSDLPRAIADAAGPFCDGVDGGMFLTLEGADGVVAFLWASEGAWSPGLSEHIAALGSTEGLDAAREVYASSGLAVQPYSVEFGGDGTATVCLWGAHVLHAADDLPSVFRSGAPDAAVFAAELAQALPDDERDAGETFVREQLYPTMVAIRPADVEAAPHLANVWRFLVGLLSMEAPFDRVATLKKVHAANRLATVQQEAFALAVARYLASHPDAQPPADLDDALVGLSADEVKDKAEALRDEFEDLAATAQADEALDVHRYAEVAWELPTIRDLLDRAVTGVFAAAEGPLHDYLVELGATGYDDDPSMMELDDIDLEMDRDAMMEEALSDDDEA